MDELFPGCCRDCGQREPVQGSCGCGYSQVLVTYFRRNPDSPCPFRERS